MFNYTAYNLGIGSTFAIPEFTEAATANDVVVSLERDFPINNVIEQIEDSTQIFIKANKKESILFDRTVGTFLVYEGKKIIIVPAPDATIEQVRINLVGTVMAMVLYQRGLFILHASAVVINGKAIAFVGRSGWGKSSIAAALNRLGYEFVTDDVLPIDLNCDRPIVYPGFGQYKLSQETAQVLGHQNSCLTNIDGYNRGYINCSITAKPLPLDRIYLLAKDTENAIAPIESIEVIKQLLIYTIPTLWALPQPPEHFFQCCKLIDTTQIYHLKRTDDISLLPKLAELIEQHVKRSAIAI